MADWDWTTLQMQFAAVRVHCSLNRQHVQILLWPLSLLETGMAPHAMICDISFFQPDAFQQEKQSRNTRFLWKQARFHKILVDTMRMSCNILAISERSTRACKTEKGREERLFTKENKNETSNHKSGQLYQKISFSLNLDWHWAWRLARRSEKLT